MLVEELAYPGDTSGPSAMLLDLFDLRQDLDTVAKKDGSFELPIADSHQGERNHTRALAAEPGQDAKSEQAMGDRLAKRRSGAIVGMQRIMVTGQRGEVSDIVGGDFSPFTQPAITNRHVLEIQRLGGSRNFQ